MYEPGTHPAFVTGYRYDIFVSYAHVDDEPLSGAPRGWVSTLVRNLEVQLATKLGRKYAPPWMDHQLAGNAPLTPEIVAALRETATLLVFVSPGYLVSDWCKREREAFLQLIRQRLDSGSRVFVVEIDRVDRNDLPDEFRELPGYRFWVEDEDGKAPRTLGIPVPRLEEPEYYTRLNNLSYELARELKRLKDTATPANGDVPSDAVAVKPAVFLAEVTDDLELLRDELKSYLLQAGLTVLSKAWYTHEDLTAYQEAIEKDLKDSRLFVQLLSAVAGRKPPGWPQGYASVQYMRAKQLGMPILQWRSRELDLASVKDPGHLALLESENVIATGIEEFKRAVVQETSKESPPPTPSRGDLVFVNTDFPDRALAETVTKLLLKHGIGSILPLNQGEPADIRKDLEANLRDCDGLIVVYGETHVTWVRNQLRQGRKILAQREQPLRCLAVFEGPPPEKDEVALNLPSLRNLNFRKGLDEGVFLEFIQCLRS